MSGRAHLFLGLVIIYDVLEHRRHSCSGEGWSGGQIIFEIEL